jgi:hypothetical protein
MKDLLLQIWMLLEIKIGLEETLMEIVITVIRVIAIAIVVISIAQTVLIVMQLIVLTAMVKTTYKAIVTALVPITVT